MHAISLRIFALMVVVLLGIPAAFSAIISGGVYDSELNTIPKVVISINSTPEQIVISKFGGYQFTVPPGSYKLVVKYTLSNVTKTIAEDFVTITDNAGEYRRDMFIFPHIKLDDSFINTSITEQTQAQVISPQIILVGAIIFVTIILVIALWIFVVAKNPKSKQVIVLPDAQTKEAIVSVLKERQGKATQKLIRKHVPSLSESKISMLLSDLEKEGIIQKIKQGRTNVIVLVPK